VKHEPEGDEQARQDGGPWLLPPAEAARLLSISARTLWSLTASREVPHLRIGRAVRYPVADLLAWIEARKIGPRAT